MFTNYYYKNLIKYLIHVHKLLLINNKNIWFVLRTYCIKKLNEIKKYIYYFST